MPVRGCDVCGAPGCTRHGRRRQRGERRPYSDTAAYRAMVVEVLETYGDACAFCAEPVGDDVVLAHVLSHADGGPFALENLRPAHGPCNAAAGRRPLEEVSNG